MARSKKKIEGNRIDESVNALEELEKWILKSKKENIVDAVNIGNGLFSFKDGYDIGKLYLISLKDKEDNYVLLPDDILSRLLDLLHACYEDRFCMQLEREIAKQMPRDFDDIWEIALDEIKKSKKGFLKIDPELLVAYIKKQHPHLFMRLEFDL